MSCLRIALFHRLSADIHSSRVLQVSEYAKWALSEQPTQNNDNAYEAASAAVSSQENQSRDASKNEDVSIGEQEVENVECWVGQMPAFKQFAVRIV